MSKSTTNGVAPPTAKLVYFTNGFETYQNPRLDEELCRFYAAERTKSKRDINNPTGNRLAKREWNNKEVSRASCKKCNGRGYQEFRKSAAAYGLSCSCIDIYLTSDDELPVDNTSSNPLELS